MSGHLSVSQLKSYGRCPYSYKLARIDHVWQRPAAWLPQGSAVHEAAEAWERSGRTMTTSETQDVFRDSYQRHVNRYCAQTPRLDFWFPSGRFDGQRDIERRYGIGLEQVDKYIDWYTSHPNEVIWIAEDGTPGIELGFNIDLDGVAIKGFIDAVIRDEDTGEIIVRDNKTGNQPGDDFQLGVYSVALAEQYDIAAPQHGDYWMGRTGAPTTPYTIGEWTRDKVAEAFHELDGNIRAGKFEPTPDERTCSLCDVAASCEYSAA